MTAVISKTCKLDGRWVIVHVAPDGSETIVMPEPTRDMTDEEVLTAALSDPDAQPLTDELAAKLQPVARVKTLRRALGLTQEEFAVRHCIPLGALRDWEQGRARPDQPNRAYLKVIAHDPEGVARALAPQRA